MLEKRRDAVQSKSDGGTRYEALGMDVARKSEPRDWRSRGSETNDALVERR
jgi:hypothetical protein